MTEITAPNKALAQEAQKLIDGDPNRMMLFLGTGVSKGMCKRDTDGYKACDWVEFVKKLAEGLPDDCPEKKAFAAIPPELLESSTKVTLGAAHMIRDKLVELLLWDRDLKGICERIWADRDPGSPWSKFLLSMREANDPTDDPNLPLIMPLILTTNYDSLLEECLGSHVLLNPDLSRKSPDQPRPGFQLLSAQKSFGGFMDKNAPRTIYEVLDKDSSQSAFLQQVIDAEMLWKLHWRGLLGRGDAFVHHVHGSVHHPLSAVFDAADYERVIQSQLWHPLAKVFMQPKTVPVFAGVGAGIFDRHLTKVWAAMENSQNSEPMRKPRTPIYWLVEEGKRVESEELREKMPGDGKEILRIVSQKDFDWMPLWINEVFSEKNRYNF